ncbi:3-deoxy-D-manno-oct-2-ulosonic acid (Kdo) hydroxylase domain-containing protein [Ditylenchus destructor]|nr:3-deoxy-D-manno-oct-2-ulosonic acid (Kdo) hydroxylase domain-containing protein [Ditylenchus destructor]
MPGLDRPFAGKHRLMRALRVTKALRSDYDHYMLGLHDGMKADLGYQRSLSEGGLFEFPAGANLDRLHRPGLPRRPQGPVRLRADLPPARRRDGRPRGIAAAHARAHDRPHAGRARLSPAGPGPDSPATGRARPAGIPFPAWARTRSVRAARGPPGAGSAPNDDAAPAPQEREHPDEAAGDRGQPGHRGQPVRLSRAHGLRAGRGPQRPGRTGTGRRRVL